MTDLVDLPIGKLMAHPDNPRLQMREDVLERLSAEIERNGFGREHALLVRPKGGAYQIVSGHHRAEAAERLGLDELPCWVREMDDDEAFMLLVLSNTQGELSPLEIGMHALKAVPLAEGGRGKKGGLSEYAERIGRDQSRVSQLRAAAQVYSQTHEISHGFDPRWFDKKADHLYEISKSPRETWSQLVELLVAKSWTVADTALHVSALRQFDIPEEHQKWLPLADVMAEYLDNSRFDAGKVKRIIAAADAAVEWIAANAELLDAEEFTNWLIRNNREIWDPKKIDSWLVDLIGRVRERKLTPEIRVGDFRDVLADLPDDSVDLILTDPPYGDEAIPNYEWLAEFAARKLKPGGSLICYTGQSILPDVFAALGKHLRYWWPLSLQHLHGGQQLPGKWVMVEWKPIAWYVRDYRNGENYVADTVRGSKPDKNAHEWAQGIDEVFYLIEQLTKPDALVVDPFAGSGSFGKAALSLGRRFIGADLDPDSGIGQVVA